MYSAVQFSEVHAKKMDEQFYFLRRDAIFKRSTGLLVNAIVAVLVSLLTSLRAELKYTCYWLQTAFFKNKLKSENYATWSGNIVY